MEAITAHNGLDEANKYIKRSKFLIGDDGQKYYVDGWDVKCNAENNGEIEIVARLFPIRNIKPKEPDNVVYRDNK